MFLNLQFILIFQTFCFNIYEKITFSRNNKFFICKIIMRLLLASALNIKNMRRIKLNSSNTFLFDYSEYVKINR